LLRKGRLEFRHVGWCCLDGLPAARAHARLRGLALTVCGLHSGDLLRLVRHHRDRRAAAGNEPSQRGHGEAMRSLHALVLSGRVEMSSAARGSLSKNWLAACTRGIECPVGVSERRERAAAAGIGAFLRAGSCWCCGVRRRPGRAVLLR